MSQKHLDDYLGQLSNDEEGQNGSWSSYQVTTTWVLSTTDESAASSYVYGWFRDAHGEVYSVYFDGVVYDPAPPQGSIDILGNDVITGTVWLWLEASDDNSGVSEMRISEDPTLSDAAWRPYEQFVERELTSGVVYAQFRDRAGNLSPIYGSISSEQKVFLPLIAR